MAKSIPEEKPLPVEMRIFRRAQTIDKVTTRAGWWYINHDSIDIVAQSPVGGTMMVRLSRKQLERAIQVMSRAE